MCIVQYNEKMLSYVLSYGVNPLPTLHSPDSLTTLDRLRVLGQDVEVVVPGGRHLPGVGEEASLQDHGHHGRALVGAPVHCQAPGPRRQAHGHV